ncbi:hypothetical protein ACQJBY_048407 [Aegilops geniculata]
MFTFDLEFFVLLFCFCFKVLSKKSISICLENSKKARLAHEALKYLRAFYNKVLQDYTYDRLQLVEQGPIRLHTYITPVVPAHSWLSSVRLVEQGPIRLHTYIATDMMPFYCYRYGVILIAYIHIILQFVHARIILM